MKKAFISLILGVVLTTTVVLPVEAGGRGQNYSHNNINGWAAAAIGAVIGVAVGAAIVNQQTPTYVYGQSNYNSQPSAYSYSAQQACQVTQVPVYDQYGRLVQYRQVCAN